MKQPSFDALVLGKCQKDDQKVLFAESAYNSQNTQFGLVMKQLKNSTKFLNTKSPPLIFQMVRTKPHLVSYLRYLIEIIQL